MFGCCHRQHSHAQQGWGAPFWPPSPFCPPRMFPSPLGFSLSLCSPTRAKAGEQLAVAMALQDGDRGSCHPKTGEGKENRAN